MAVEYWLMGIRRNAVWETGRIAIGLPEQMQLLIVISCTNQINICLKLKSQHLNKYLLTILIPV
jgi:hypothetical protein